MSWEEKLIYYRLIPIGGHSEALILELYTPHKSILKGFISMRRVRRGPSISISMPLRMSKWFDEHRELRRFFPERVLTIIPFNVESAVDIDILTSIVKALYGFKDVRELYREKVRAGRIKPIEAGLDPHYQLFLNANTSTKITIDKLYDLLRETGSEDSTP